MPDRKLDHRKKSAGMKTEIRQIEERMLAISRAAEDKITETVRRLKMNKLQKAWAVLSDFEQYVYCDQADCTDCPQNGKDQHRCAGTKELENWLRTNGFPARRPHIYTVDELAKQIIKGRSRNCLEQWIAQHVEAVICPGCKKNTLFRERRMECAKCTDVYPAGRWAAGEPCGCGCMDASYYGYDQANGLGQLEFQRCRTPGCLWSDVWRLNVHKLADKIEDMEVDQLVAVRTCPACGDASGNDQRDGAYLPIEECGCGWRGKQ